MTMPEIWCANLMEHMTPWSVQWLCLLPELWGQIFQFMADPTHLDYPRYTGVWKKKLLRVFTAILSANLLVFSQMGSCRVWKTWWVEASGWLSAKYLSFAILNILNVFNIFHDIAKDLKYVGYFYCCGYSAMWKLQVKFPMVNLGPRDKWDIKGKVKKEKKNQLNS